MEREGEGERDVGSERERCWLGERERNKVNIQRGNSMEKETWRESRPDRERTKVKEGLGTRTDERKKEVGGRGEAMTTYIQTHTHNIPKQSPHAGVWVLSEIS